MGESDGVASIQVGAVQGSIQAPVVVEMSTRNISATGELTVTIIPINLKTFLIS